MSITPVREDDGETRESTREANPGVRARWQSWLASVARRIRSTLGSAETESDAHDPETAQSGQIRVSGRRKLTGSHEPPPQSGDDGLPPARRMLPDGTDIDAKRDGETLRIYDPQREEAFMLSDTWTDVEE